MLIPLSLDPFVLQQRHHGCGLQLLTGSLKLLAQLPDVAETKTCSAYRSRR